MYLCVRKQSSSSSKSVFDNYSFYFYLILLAKYTLLFENKNRVAGSNQNFKGREEERKGGRNEWREDSRKKNTSKNSKFMLN